MFNLLHLYISIDEAASNRQAAETEWHPEFLLSKETLFYETSSLSAPVPPVGRSDFLPPILPTLLPSRDETCRLLDHLLHHLANHLEVLLLRSSELVHTKMIPRESIFPLTRSSPDSRKSRRLQISFFSISTALPHGSPSAYLDPAPMEDGADVARLLLVEAGYASLALPLPRLEEVRCQVHQTFVARSENVQHCFLDLIFLVLTLSSLDHLCLVQPASASERRPEEHRACG